MSQNRWRWPRKLRWMARPSVDDDVGEHKLQPEWNWPVRIDAFLAQLADSGLPGRNDAERVAGFMENSQAAPFMPAGLRADLDAEGLL